MTSEGGGGGVVISGEGSLPGGPLNECLGGSLDRERDVAKGSISLAGKMFSYWSLKPK